MTQDLSNRSMRINLGAGRGSNQVRRSLYQKVTANSEKSIAGSVKLLDNPDLDVTVKSNIGNDEVLTWNSTQSRFVNSTIASIVSSASLARRVREFFVKAAGDDTASGVSSSAAVKNFEIALKQMSTVSTTYEMVQFWILGSVIFNTGNFNGIIREGVLGNIRRGVCIRGVPQATNWAELGNDDAPRSGGGLSHGLALIPSGALSTNTFTAIGLSTEVSNNLNSWAANTDLDITTVFLKGANGIYPVVVDNTTTADPDGVQAAAKRRLYLVTSDTNPTAALGYEQWGFTSKITCTDLLGDGLAANTVKPGWTASGNVQFVEIHVELKNDAVPVHINGEFQILYSMFSNVTPGGTTATLSLTASGVCDNADATAEVVSAVTKVATRVIRIYKSVFKDLNIIVNSALHFQDCVFYGCQFNNPKGAVFESCLFYISRPHIMGDSDLQHYLSNSMSLNKCMIVYGTAGSFATCDNESGIILKNVLCRPLKTNGPQSVPLLLLRDESYATIDGLHIPANSGINTSGTGENEAIVVSGNDADLELKDLKVLSTGANELPIILAKDNTQVLIEDIENACINGGPLITAFNCKIDLHNFDLTLDAAYLLVQTTQGFFELSDCNVTVSASFELDASASTNAILFNLSSTKLANVIGETLNTNKFNIINHKTKKMFHIADNSSVSITTGDPSSVANSAQKNLVGRVVVDSYSTFDAIGTPDASWATDWSENVDWVMDDEGNGLPIFDISNRSQVNIDTINLNVTEGGTQTAGQRSKLATLTESCEIVIRRSLIDVNGQNSQSSLSAIYNSAVRIDTCKLMIRNGSSASLISITEDSSLSVVNPTPAVPTLFVGENANTLVEVDYNSNANFRNISFTAGTSCLQGITVSNGSKLLFTAASSNPAPIIYTGTTGPTDAIFDVFNASEVSIEHVTFAPAAAGGQLLFAKGLCNCDINGANASGGNVPNKAITIEDGTRLYVGTDTNDIPVEYAVGTKATARQTITKTALDTQHIFPKQSEIATVWDDLRGCAIIKSD